MTDFVLRNNQVVTIPITGMDASGKTAMLEEGAMLVAASSSPLEVAAVIVGSSLVIRALVPTASGVSVTVGGSGLASSTIVVDVDYDPAPVRLALDLRSTEATVQEVPATSPPPPPPPAPDSAGPEEAIA